MSQPQRRRRAGLLPPYSHDIPAAPMRTVCISAGPRAWERGRAWKREGNPGLVFPPGENPALYAWPVQNRQVAVIATDMAREDLLDLISCLVDAEAAVIAVVHGEEDADKVELLVPGRDV